MPTSPEVLGVPDEAYFGEFGGVFVAETLMRPLSELREAFATIVPASDFQDELDRLLREFAGRPTPLYEAKRLSEGVGARVFLKREDVLHTGAHKINNTLGQVLLAKRMGKLRVIAETGAGQHGVATATAAALFGMECTVFMGTVDIERQAPNVDRMRLLGAEVVPVTEGSATLKSAINAALREWAAYPDDVFYVLGSVVGPDPYPRMVRDFQRVIGDEARAQLLAAVGRLPDVCLACVGGGSNAIGLFTAFLDDPVRLVGVEAAGEGLNTGRHGASIARGRPGVLHGTRSLFLQDEHGSIEEAHSVSAGLDYPGVGPEHAFLAMSGRASYISVTDVQAVKAFRALSLTEGIIPALESAHAIAALSDMAWKGDEIVCVCLSGRGDKDLASVAAFEDETASGGRPR